MIGATVDLLVYPLLASGAALPSIVLAQLAAKIAGGMRLAVITAADLRWTFFNPLLRRLFIASVLLYPLVVSDRFLVRPLAHRRSDERAGLWKRAASRHATWRI
jgi:hypothetical protein